MDSKAHSLAELLKQWFSQESDAQESEKRIDPEQAMNELAAIATSQDLPTLFRALEDPDVRSDQGLFYSVFYVAEDMGDAYLEALAQNLPGLWHRAPGWAQTAVVRLLNTAGEDDDCVDAYLSATLQAGKDSCKALAGVIGALQEQEDDLGNELAQTLREVLKPLVSKIG